MLLSDRDLVTAISEGELEIHPFDGQLLQPASIDFLLGPQFLVFTRHEVAYIDPYEDNTTLAERVVATLDDPFVLHPGEFALAATEEIVTLGSSLAARVEGKSSLGRLGLITHSTAGFVDPGFSGHITLELANISNLPILLYPGMRIGQLCVFQLSSPAEEPYGASGRGSKYMDQRGPVASQYYRNARPTPKEN